MEIGTQARRLPGQGVAIRGRLGGGRLYLSASLAAPPSAPRMPMRAKYEDGAEFRWLNKPVLASRLLDSMEDLSPWSFKGAGAMTLTDVRAKDGRHSLRIRSMTNVAQVSGAGEWMDLVATRKFAGEDWRPYNRISLWVYPDVIGAPAIACTLVLHNDGAHKLPDRYNEGRDESIILKDHVWNHVVWEIAPLEPGPRDGTRFRLQPAQEAPQPGDQTILDIDKLELQRVDADYVEGWNVAPGKIAFSHSGYTTGAAKSAIASDVNAREFSLIDLATGLAVLTKPIEQIATPLGKYQVLDFSEVREPGEYAIQARRPAHPPLPHRRGRLAKQYLEGHQLHVLRTLRERRFRAFTAGAIRISTRPTATSGLSSMADIMMPVTSARPGTPPRWFIRCCRWPTI